MADTVHCPPTTTFSALPPGAEESSTKLLTPQNAFVTHVNTCTSPPRAKVAAYEIFEGISSPNLKVMRERLLVDTYGHFQGPMPVSEFFDSFMPWNDDVDKLYKAKTPAADQLRKISTLPECTEGQSYGQFINAFQGCLTLRASASPKRFGGQLRLVDSHLYRDRDCGLLGVDISVYSGRRFVPRIQKDTKMDFANLHCWIELRPTRDYDPFDDTPNAKPQKGAEQGDKEVEVESDGQQENGTDEEEDDEDDNEEDEELDVAAENEHRPRCQRVDEETNKREKHAVNNLAAVAPNLAPFERNTAKALETRAQLASYAGATLATQYRTHLFSVIITGNIARFIRWDRASAIVTEAFDIVNNPILLFHFFRRFRQLTLEQRGTIPHVRPAFRKHATIARGLLKDLAPELWLGTAGYLFLKTQAIDIDSQPFVEVTYNDQVFIVPAPHCLERRLSPFGRASRGSAAVWLNNGEGSPSAVVCFLKDSWPDMHCDSEPEIYHQLKSAKVSNVAKMICGGDWGPLPGQQPYTTIGMTGTSWMKQMDKCPVRNLRACLIALDVVGRPLVAFRKAYQLIRALADATQAYEEAFSKAAIMHRDISPHNILIVQERGSGKQKGLLIDWDHATKLGAKARGTWRTGTWQFMSINLTQAPQMGEVISHSAMDDRESIFYALLWTAMRHLKHNIDAFGFQLLLTAFDDRQSYLVKGIWTDVGGYQKRTRLEDIAIRNRYLEFETKGLNEFIRLVATAILRRYQTAPVDFANPMDDEQKQDLDEWNKAHDAKLKKTIDNPNWLQNELRKLHDKLKTLQDANADKDKDKDKDDWVDNMKSAQHLQAPIGKSLQRSRYHTAYPSSSNKRVIWEDNKSDQPPVAKRSKSEQ